MLHEPHRRFGLKLYSTPNRILFPWSFTLALWVLIALLAFQLLENPTQTRQNFPQLLQIYPNFEQWYQSHSAQLHASIPEATPLQSQPEKQSTIPKSCSATAETLWDWICSLFIPDWSEQHCPPVFNSNEPQPHHIHNESHLHSHSTGKSAQLQQFLSRALSTAPIDILRFMDQILDRFDRWADFLWQKRMYLCFPSFWRFFVISFLPSDSPICLLAIGLCIGTILGQYHSLAPIYRCNTLTTTSQPLFRDNAESSDIPKDSPPEPQLQGIAPITALLWADNVEEQEEIATIYSHSLFNGSRRSSFSSVSHHFDLEEESLQQ